MYKILFIVLLLKNIRKNDDSPLYKNHITTIFKIGTNDDSPLLSLNHI